MGSRNDVTKGDLQDALVEAADRLTALALRPIARKAFLNEDDPDDLEALAGLTLDVARALDCVFHEISYRGGLGSRSKASAHAAYVSNAVEGNLDFELRDRAERILANTRPQHPDDEHRMTAADLGIGRRS